MQSGQPSRTALGAAIQRAAHQIADGGRVFKDPLAVALLGPNADAQIQTVLADPAQQQMRLFMAARSRFAEDSIAAAISRGTRQIVVLGAGLDTFSLRNPYPSTDLHVFEVDHPATQGWKRRRMLETNVVAPTSLTFVPMDFKHEILAQRLNAVGFRAHDPAFFHWLGVVPYLTSETITKTLEFIGNLSGSEVVFDYSEPLENYAIERRASVAAMAARTAAIGEPWLSYFNPSDLAAKLREWGFDDLEDIGLGDIAVRYLGAPNATINGGAGPHVVRAQRTN